MIRDYIKLIKFRYNLSFILVILGALLYAPQINLSLLLSLVLVYISFNILMYTGLYTLNDIIDRESDSKHPKKKQRVIPSGKISLFQAWMVCIWGIFFGLLMAFLLFRSLFYIYLCFIAFNIFYTFFAKKIPYLELIGNSITYPLRLLTGIILVGGVASIGPFIAIFFTALCTSAMRRIIERRYQGYEARKVLTHYTDRSLIIAQVLSFSIILVTLLIDFPRNFLFYLSLIIFCIVFDLILGYNKKLRKYLNYLWLN